MSDTSNAVPKTPSEWAAAFESLPSTVEDIPAFFFAHGSPLLVFPENEAGSFGPAMADQGPKGTLANFLKEFGPTLIKKYNPKGIVVFSAHWETDNERLVTDYGDENPLLMDYYGFQPQLYQLKFKSRGDSALSNRVVELFKEAGHRARTTPKSEPRGQDGRGFPGPGLDHGVFVPFRIMFGEEFFDIPIVQVSIDSSMSAEKNWEVGKAVRKLRNEGILILSGGLTIHNLRDMSSFGYRTASPLHKAFDQAVLDAVSIPSVDERKKAMIELTRHAGFRACHPREDHFIPLYVGAGAGEGGVAKILNGNYGTPTFAFGI